MKKAERKQIWLKMEIQEMKNNDFIVTKTEASLTLSSETNFDEIIKFQKESKRIIKKAIAGAKKGARFEIQLNIGRYNSVWNNNEFIRSEQVDFNAWIADSSEQDFQDGEQLYFKPDTRYTEDYRDLFIGTDVFTTLANANI